MVKMYKEKELDNIRLEISKLKEKERLLYLEVLESKKDFIPKFQFWLESGEGEIAGDLFDLKNRCPEAREHFVDSEMDRMREYDFAEYFDDDFGWLIDDFKGTDYYTDEAKEDIRVFAEAIMKSNIRGVIWDW